MVARGRQQCAGGGCRSASESYIVAMTNTDPFDAFFTPERLRYYRDFHRQYRL
ncbi:MAG: hypothetical protein ACE5JI_11635 [Acidobacteriota bacterium]